MPYAEVGLTIQPSVRVLCCMPYHQHPRGCPNYGQRTSCPPQAPHLTDVLDLTKPVFAIWNVYDLATHVTTLRAKHPTWSERQLYCCLYWQGTARKHLRAEIDWFLMRYPTYTVLTCPEACGVNVTQTMADIGERLEWPVVTKAYQVAIAGYDFRRR